MNARKQKQTEMKKNLLLKGFWDKPILTTGTHDVVISHIEEEINNNLKATPFVILFYENTNGWFPHKINLDLESQSNLKYIKMIFEYSQTECHSDFKTNINLLLNKKIEIFIGQIATLDFGSGVKVNTISKSKKTND